MSGTGAASRESIGPFKAGGLFVLDTEAIMAPRGYECQVVNIVRETMLVVQSRD